MHCAQRYTTELPGSLVSAQCSRLCSCSICIAVIFHFIAGCNSKCRHSYKALGGSKPSWKSRLYRVTLGQSKYVKVRALEGAAGWSQNLEIPSLLALGLLAVRPASFARLRRLGKEKVLLSIGLTTLH